jgi:MFS transporter, DHA1 family, multidrug resistance protein
MMAAIMLVFSISPMLAPLTGSALLTITGWRGIFGALLVALTVGLLLLTFLQKETLAPDNRRPLRMGLLLRGLGELLFDRTFMLLSFIAGFGFSSFMIFLSSASYVYTESFGLQPAQFSLAFAANAVFFIGASQAAGWAQLKYGVRKVLTTAAGWFCLMDGLLFLLALAGHATLVPTIVMLGLGNAGLGLIIPTTMMLALDTQGEKAGLASSLGGTIQMMTGAVVAAAVGPWLSASPVPMLGGIFMAAATAFVLVLFAMRSYAATEGALV